MAKDITEGGDNDDGSSFGKWGAAHKRRGLSYVDLATEFVYDHPIGSAPFSATVLDQWLHDHEMLVLPPAAASKNSDAWMAHLQRRHLMRGRINKAASHPRMLEYGSTPFTIVTAAGSSFEVLAPQTAASRAELPRKIQSIAVTKRKQLGYLMQSSDWSALPVHEQAIAEAIYDDIEAFVEDTTKSAQRIGVKLHRLERRIKTLMDLGEVRPINGGLRQLLAIDQEVIDDDIDNDTDGG